MKGALILMGLAGGLVFLRLVAQRRVLRLLEEAPGPTPPEWGRFAGLARLPPPRHTPPTTLEGAWVVAVLKDEQRPDSR